MGIAAFTAIATYVQYKMLPKEKKVVSLVDEKPLNRPYYGYVDNEAYSTNNSDRQANVMY